MLGISERTLRRNLRDFERAYWHSGGVILFSVDELRVVARRRCQEEAAKAEREHQTADRHRASRRQVA